MREAEIPRSATRVLRAREYIGGGVHARRQISSSDQQLWKHESCIYKISADIKDRCASGLHDFAHV